MWNLIACSKITEDKFQKLHYKMHRDKLKSMKAITKIKEPEQPDFVYTKNKLQMSRRDREIQIEKQNSILLMKMENIKVHHHPENRLRAEAQNLKTLNSHNKEEFFKKVYHENSRICQKLLRVTSFYPTVSIIGKTDELQKMRQNISINARRIKSAKSLWTRPQSSYTTRSAKFYRTGGKSLRKFESEDRHALITNLQSEQNEKVSRPQSAPAIKRSSIAEKKKQPKENNFFDKKQQNAEEKEARMDEIMESQKVEHRQNNVEDDIVEQF